MKRGRIVTAHSVRAALKRATFDLWWRLKRPGLCSLLLRLAILWCILPGSVHASPLTLKECYQRALEVRETLKQRTQDIRAAEARYQQALAELYPQIGLAANQRVRDSANFGSLSAGTFNDPSTGLPRSRQLGYTQFETLVTLTQPIFRGFRELALSRASQAEQSSLTHLLEREKQLLFLDVAELFYQLLLFQDQEQQVAKGEQTFRDRINELQEFVSLGKSRESEIHAAQADLAQQALLKERIIRSKVATREVFASLLQIPTPTLELEPKLPLVPRAQLDRLLETVRQREDIKAAIASEQVVEELITAEERSWWPSINLDMNSYQVDDPNRHRDWDALLRFSIPVFDGGRIAARIAEQQAQLIKRQSEAAERKRVAERDVRQSFVQLEHSQEALKQAHLLQVARRKSYESQRTDYKNGQVTNIDVMNALTLLQRAELDVIESRYSAVTDAARLSISAGELPL